MEYSEFVSGRGAPTITTVVISDRSQTQISYNLTEQINKLREKSRSGESGYEIEPDKRAYESRSGASAALTRVAKWTVGVGLIVLLVAFVLFQENVVGRLFDRFGDKPTSEPSTPPMAQFQEPPKWGSVQMNSNAVTTTSDLTTPVVQPEGSVVARSPEGPPPMRPPKLDDGRWKWTTLVLGDCDPSHDWTSVRGSYDVTIQGGEPRSILRVGDYNPQRKKDHFRQYLWETRGMGHPVARGYVRTLDVDFVTGQGSSQSYRFVYLRPQSHDLGVVGVWYQMGERFREDCLWGTFVVDSWDGGFPSMTDPQHNECLRACSRVQQPGLDDLDRFGYDGATLTSWARCARSCFFIP